MKTSNLSIIEHFKAQDIDLSGDIDQRVINSISINEHFAAAYVGLLSTYLANGRKLVHELDRYLKDYSGQWTIDQAKRADERRAERIHMWVLWGERLVRWSVGAFLAVLLYSGAVWLSDTVEFFKVPVRDWLPWTNS